MRERKHLKGGKKNKVVAFFILLVLFSCERSNDVSYRNADSLAIKDEKKYVSGEQINTSITENSLLVDSVAVVLCNPDSVESQQYIQKAGGENEYQEILLDNEYYQGVFLEYATSKGISIYFTDKKFLIFKTWNGNLYTLNRDSIDSKWAIIIFNKEERPIIVDATSDFKKKCDIYLDAVKK